jgi:hypothetical protein
LHVRGRRKALRLIEEAIQKRASEWRAWGDEYGAQALMLRHLIAEAKRRNAP